MSKTIRMSDVIRDAREAKQQVEEQARVEARFRVIQAKRAMHGRALAYVDGVPQDGGVDARSDVVTVAKG
jgi:hypothetical protein